MDNKQKKTIKANLGGAKEYSDLENKNAGKTVVIWNIIYWSSFPERWLLICLKVAEWVSPVVIGRMSKDHLLPIAGALLRKALRMKQDWE